MGRTTEDFKESHRKRIAEQAAAERRAKEEVPLFGHLQKTFDYWLEDEIEKSPDDIEICRSRFITDFYNQLGDFRRYIEVNHKADLRRRSAWYPRDWMAKDRVISSLLEKYRIADVLNALEASKKYDRSTGRMEYLFLVRPEGHRYRGKYEYAAIMADAAFYKTILPGLGMAQITLQKYLSAFSRAGILRVLEKEGQRHIPIYTIGYFSEYKRGKLNRWTTTKTKNLLRGFSL